MTDQAVPEEMHVISGEQATYKATFASGDYVYINRGASQGVKAGDEFLVLRRNPDPSPVVWFKWQKKLMRAMGTPYQDQGRIQVVQVQEKVSIAKVVFACGMMQRGDIIRPFEARPAPAFKEAAAFDHFAPKSGKEVAMVVTTSMLQSAAGRNDVVYVNLGGNQGVKVGDYFRVFRYQGTRAETVPQTENYHFKLYGFGGTREEYGPEDLPREVLGEGIVLNVTRNSSVVLITVASSEIFSGDYVEIE
ncbi:MAG: hypothetical protein LAN84_08575 [Acidobacteriia bacterium]|nr:hypothetical protein [Terriglobia bacterium]